MSIPSVSVAQGLGVETGYLFARTFRAALKAHGIVSDFTLPYIDAAVIVRALSDAKRVANVLLDALLSAPHESADLVLIPCNSVHVANPYLGDVFGARFVSIDQAVMASIRRMGRKGRFLILGTSTTIQSGIYQKGLDSLGCDSVSLPQGIQERFDSFIFNELVAGRMRAMHLLRLRKLELHYKNALAVDYVILACTELCYLVQVFSEALPWEIDSMQALGVAGVDYLLRLPMLTESHGH